MKISDQLKELMKQNNISITQLAANMKTSQPNVTSKLLRDNFKLSDIKEIANGLGYDDIELVLRGHNETVIMRENEPIRTVPNTQYLVFDEDHSLIDDIKENGFRDRQFKDIVLDLLEPYLKPKFGDLWDTYIPSEFEEGFKSVVNNQLSFDEFAEKLYNNDHSQPLSTSEED